MGVRSRVALCLAALLCAAGAPAAATPPLGRIEPGLARALERARPGDEVAVAIALEPERLPRGAGRAAALRAAQQRVVDALPRGSFRTKHRYGRIAGLAGWAQRSALDALAAHPDVALVYVDGHVSLVLAQGVSLVGGVTAHTQGYTGDGVNAAVIDSGIDATHPDLAGSVIAQECFCDDNPAPNRGCCPNGLATQSGAGAAAETDGHGTSVAGIISSDGVVAAPGIAPDTGIAAIRVFSNTGGGSFSDVDAALDWVLANHDALAIRVVNMSLGNGGQYASSTVFPCSGSNTANAVASLVAAGVAVVVASGNEGFDAGIAFPACIADAISVGGVYDANVGPVSWCGNASCSTILCTDNPTAADAFVCHANSGANLDLLAPDWRTDTPQAGGGTHPFGGTSAASPYAAGEAALLFQAKPSLAPAALRSLMKAHGPLVTSPQNGLAFRRTDVAAALATLIDSDGDGLTDAAEASLGTNPFDPDSDGDGFDDGAEVAAGSDPNDPASFPAAIPAVTRGAAVVAAALIAAAGRRRLRVRAGIPLRP
jgi:subtilisin family serine protease